jgi:hypothetical protein
LKNQTTVYTSPRSNGIMVSFHCLGYLGSFGSFDYFGFLGNIGSFVYLPSTAFGHSDGKKRSLTGSHNYDNTLWPF